MLATAAVTASASSARAQAPTRSGRRRPRPPPRQAPDRFRLVLNASFWPAKTSFGDSRTFTEYAEQTTIRTSYEAGSAFGPDVALQVSLFRGLGLLVGYSYASRDVSGHVEVSRPHPLYLNRHRSASAGISGYGLTEGDLYLDLAYARAVGHLDWALFAGATLFQVEADLLEKPTYDDVYPYDELAIASTPSTTVNESPTGFNVGGRLDYRFGRSRRFGAGVQVRYSTASVKLKAGPDATEARFDAGGLQVGAGLRVYCLTGHSGPPTAPRLQPGRGTPRPRGVDGCPDPPGPGRGGVMDGLLFTLCWVFGWVLLLILIWHLKGQRRQKRMELVHKERMMAMEKGVPLPELPEFGEPPARSALAEAVAAVRINPRWPLGLGALSVMVGAGACLAFWLSPDPEPHKAWPFGLLGVFFGIGLFFHYFLTRPATR